MTPIVVATVLLAPQTAALAPPTQANVRAASRLHELAAKAFRRGKYGEAVENWRAAEQLHRL